MNQNIFEELHDKKSKLLSLAQKAVEFGWIPKEKKTAGGKQNTIISFDEILEKLDKDTLTIGVIGQMKCGKSTFLNSFVFEDDVLPAATTPMTAALSVITYGEKERLVAEFYTPDEWEEQKMQASRDENDAANSLDLSKIKAAKELVSKATKLGQSLNSLLGKTQEDIFSNLVEYVGAEGKYVSITKSVTIYYPKDYLKGVEIVDTPGFNDPIVSREERTKDFLKKADVVVMMLYAGRPFDATDRDIIFKNVSQCGIGKVLIGINKYDIPFCDVNNPESADQIKDYVVSEIRKACRESGDDTLVDILKEANPIPISAEMALLSMLPMSKINSSDAYKYAWERHCRNFGISSQAEMFQQSHLDNLVYAVKKLVSTEKEKILFSKPINSIFAAGNAKISENNSELVRTQDLIETLNLPDSELLEKEYNLGKANKRLSKKIDLLGEEIEEGIRQIIRKGRNELEDLVDSSCQKMLNIVRNEWKRIKGFDSIEPRLESEKQNLRTRKLKRETENIASEATRMIRCCVDDFFADIEDLLMRYIPDFDSKDFVNSVQRKIYLDIEKGDIFSYDSSDHEFANFIDDFSCGASFGLTKVIENIASHNEIVTNLEHEINSISSKFDPMPYLQNALHSKDNTIETIRQSFISDLLEPLQMQVSEVKNKIVDKETELKKANAKLDDLEKLKSTLSNQLSEMNNLKSIIS